MGVPFSFRLSTICLFFSFLGRIPNFYYYVFIRLYYNNKIYYNLFNIVFLYTDCSLRIADGRLIESA